MNNPDNGARPYRSNTPISAENAFMAWAMMLSAGRALTTFTAGPFCYQTADLRETIQRGQA